MPEGEGEPKGTRRSTYKCVSKWPEQPEQVTIGYVLEVIAFFPALMIRLNPYAENESSPHSFSKTDSVCKMGAVGYATATCFVGIKSSSEPRVLPLMSLRLLEDLLMLFVGCFFGVSACHTRVTYGLGCEGFLLALPMSTMTWRRASELNDWIGLHF